MAKDNFDRIFIVLLLGLAIYFFITLAGWRSIAVPIFFLVWAYNIATK
ncbi:MAG: hypothetical protein ACK4V4_07780 [Sphingobacteriales bacterium]|jgi:hypothetical protein